MTKHRIYLASSWRNKLYPGVLAQLRAAGHEVYDFRNPGPANYGFSWSSVDPGWQSWDHAGYVRGLQHPAAEIGFGFDFAAMQWATAGVLLMPCGRSAHLEAGWLLGAGKPVAFLIPEAAEPELMYLLAGVGNICSEVTEVLDVLGRAERPHDADLLGKVARA